ncbi:MAG: hypothetical protein ACI9G1_002965 [Pirellulaceae bacterium]|jgi:hypothetical protein
MRPEMLQNQALCQNVDEVDCESTQAIQPTKFVFNANDRYEIARKRKQ